MAHVGARIRALRTERNITLPDLAADASMSKGLLSKIETDPKSNPSLSTLYKIAEALELSVADILHTPRITPLVTAPASTSALYQRLKAWLKELKKEPDPDILLALQGLRNRKAAKKDDFEHWKHLYTSIENSFKR